MTQAEVRCRLLRQKRRQAVGATVSKSSLVKAGRGDACALRQLSLRVHQCGCSPLTAGLQVPVIGDQLPLNAHVDVSSALFGKAPKPGRQVGPQVVPLRIVALSVRLQGASALQTAFGTLKVGLLGCPRHGTAAESSMHATAGRSAQRAG